MSLKTHQQYWRRGFRKSNSLFVFIGDRVEPSRFLKSTDFRSSDNVGCSFRLSFAPRRPPSFRRSSVLYVASQQKLLLREWPFKTEKDLPFVTLFGRHFIRGFLYKLRQGLIRGFVFNEYGKRVMNAYFNLHLNYECVRVLQFTLEP